MKSSIEQVLDKVRHLWPEHDSAEIMAELDRYGVEPHERERDRVQLGILKLSGGQLKRLPALVDMAKGDYRDVLAYAEYPEEARLSYEVKRRLPPEELQAIRARDREKYLRWLHGESKRPA
jgi:hypothetical protein